jgi:uncharacterized protein YcaQ
MTEKISLHTLRQVMLAAQGLDRPPDRPAVKADMLAAIRRMAYLQIDTINVINRSHLLVLWSRLGDYPSAWLDELLAEGKLFEHWAHAMCFLLIEDYPLYRRRMLDGEKDWGFALKWAARWSRDNPEIIQRMRNHLQENGAARSAEFERKEGSPPGGWWNWKEEKNALEAMLFTGEVMIARRHNFQRVYDLRQRVLPVWDDSTLPSSEEVRSLIALQAVRALGVALPAWVSAYFQLPKTGLAKRLEALAADGLLHPLQVEGFTGPAYLHPDHLPLLERAASGNLQPELTTLLSPFDPLVSDRQRARELFGFDYLIECYTPAAKRRYGYFTLPILHRGCLIGRLDPKAHRSQGVFEVKALHLEPGVQVTAELATDLALALRRLAAWHGTPDLVIRRSDPPEFTALLEASL